MCARARAVCGYDEHVTDVLRVDPRRPDPEAVRRAADCLRMGGLVAFPTETVYGLGVHALNAEAVRRLFEAKQRPADDPLIVHVLALNDAVPLVAGVPDQARRLASRFWPGPLTLVLRRSSIVPAEVTAGLDTVALRAPSHPIARALLAEAGLPVAAPSANLFSRPSPTRAEHVLEDLAGRIDLVLDGGPTSVGVESTVLDLSADPPVVLRPGAVSAEMLRDVVPGIAHRSRENAGPMRSPGLLSKHYSPNAPLTLFEGNSAGIAAALAAAARGAVEEGRRPALLLADEDVSVVETALDRRYPSLMVRTLGSIDDLEGVASRLYRVLRELDREGADIILARGFPAHSGLGVAVRDRLRRAAAGRIVQV